MKFEEVLNINVNDKTEKKNNLTYLSWAWAWGEFKKIYPSATYEIVKNGGIPYFADESGAMVYTKVTADELTYEMWLPVMDYRNKAMKKGEFTMFDVNKTIMRCLTKNLAMFGLGLYIYAGEDLPEGETKETKEEQVIVQKPSKPEPVFENTNASMVKGIERLIEANTIDRDKFNAWLETTYKTSDLYLLTIEQLLEVKEMVDKKKPITKTI